MELLNDVLIILTLVLLNGVFASLEIAVLTINQDLVRRRARSGDRRAAIVHSFVEDSSRFLATIQIAITLSGFLASATGAAVLARPLAEFIHTNITFLSRYATGISVVAITVIITFFTLVFGELVPKRLGMQLPQRIAFGLARPAAALAYLFGPVNAVLTWSTNSTLKVMGVSLETIPQILSIDEVRRLLRERAKIPKDEMELIGRVFDFGDHVAKEIMVPRVQMETVSSQATLNEAAEIIDASGYSRLPVTGETVDEIVGLISVKDILADIVAGNGAKSVETVMRSVVFFPDTKLTIDVLKEMQLAHAELAILIDEYGGVAGLVTIEDLVEELVGEIRDPFDTEEFTMKQVEEKTYLIHGSTDLEAVNSQLGLSLETQTAYETISGYILSELGYIPESGEMLERSDIVYKIQAMADKRIELVEITIPESKQPLATEPDSPRRENGQPNT